MAATDVLTATEAKQTLRVNDNDTTNAALLTAVVAAVSGALDDMCGPIVQRTVTAERHDGSGWAIQLRRAPVTSITSVTEYEGATATTLTEETVGTIPSNGYLLRPYSPASAPYSGRIERRTGGEPCVFAEGEGNVVVTYVAGRYATTGAVAENFKHAARLTLENWWQQFRDSTGSVGEFEVPVQAFPRFAVPSAARHLLGAEVHNEVGRNGQPTRVQIG